jgi:hypothetical protein
MSLLPLFTAALLSTTADAAPRKGQVHAQLQTGVLSRQTVRVDESDTEQRTTAIGPGAGGATLAVGYHLRRASEVGGRLELGQVTIDDGTTDQHAGHLRAAGYYTHVFPLGKDLRATATGLLGVQRTNLDGDATARSPFLGAGGGVAWFANPRTSLNAGLELTHTLGGRYEQDGVEGSSRYSAFQGAVVGGLNVYFGGPKHPRPKAGKKGKGKGKGKGRTARR